MRMAAPLPNDPLAAKQVAGSFDITNVFPFDTRRCPAGREHSRAGLVIEIHAKGIAQVGFVNVAHLKKRLGQANGHGSVIGIAQRRRDVPLASGVPSGRTNEGQFADGVAYRCPDHSAQELGLQANRHFSHSRW